MAASTDKLAFLFPGQGSQRTGMLEAVRAANPAFAAHLAALDAALAARAGRSLLALASRGPSAEHDRELTATENAQPALGLYSLALARFARDLGVVADYYVGHSYGELSALAAAGALDEASFLALSVTRGALMAEAGALAPGAMLAVRADEATTRGLLPDGEVVVANLNAPKQSVVSGSTAAIDALAARLDAAGVGAVRLRTSCAFHSPLMAPVASRFAAALDEATIPGTGAERVVGNVSAAPYAPSAAAVREGLARQLTAPVRFAESIERLYALGVRTFVEVGPGRVLTDLVAQILGARPHRAMALESEGARVATTLASLARPVPSPTAPSTEAMAIAASAERVLASVLAHQREIARLAEGAAPADRARVASALATSSERLFQDFLLTQRAALGLGAATVLAAAPIVPAPVPATAASVAATSTVTAEPESLESFLRRALVELTGFPADMIRLETDFERDLALDSITMVELFCQLMDRYPAVKDLGQALRSMKTVGAVLEALTAAVAPADSGVQVVTTASALRETAPALDVRALIVECTGCARGALSDDAMLERDLGLDVFAREALADALVAQAPAVSVAGRELLRDRTVGQLVALVTTLTAPAPSSVKTAIAAPVSAPAPQVVKRFTRSLVAQTAAVAKAALRGSLLVVGPAGQRLRALATLGASRGLDVRTVVVSDAGFAVDDEMLGFHDVEGLRDRLAAVAANSPAVLFLATRPGGARRTLVETALDTRALDTSALALFTLAKALSTADASRPAAARLGVLGSGDVLLRGAVGVARSLAREWSIPVRSATLAGETPPARVFDVLLGGASEHDLVLDGMRVSRYELTAAAEAPTAELRFAVKPHEAVLFVGGGRGITAELAVAMAERSRCRVAVVGRTALPVARPFAECADDASLTAKVRARLGTHADESSVRRAVAEAKRARELWDTKARVEAAGGQFFYRVADATRPGELADALSDLRAEAGPFVGVVHGVGMAEDARVGDKSVASFRRVLDVKVKSALLVRTITQGEPLRFAFFLSSLAAHVGTAGQTDYVAANEIVNALADDWRRESDGSVNVRALLFSVWTESGLAGAALKRQMDRLGLDGVSNAEGRAAFLRELDQADDEAWVLHSPETTLAYAALAKAG